MFMLEANVFTMSCPKLYTYLGGGAFYQPPHGFCLVFRGLPHSLADNLCALLLVHTNAYPDARLFVPRKAMDEDDRALAVARLFVNV